jgi:D-beta-D-heptose 7-phosphate kinase/D-beta-D-heptose 1-phosphate adenosyltransferase
MKKDPKSKKKVVVYVSGGFDPLHIGHIRLFEAAKKLGDELVVSLNNDAWLTVKRGQPFMPEQERKEILEALRCVDRVVISRHKIIDPKKISKEDYAKWYGQEEMLREVKPDIFAQGGDRDAADAATPDSPVYYELVTCAELGCKMVYNVGHGGKVQSSSWLIGKAKNKTKAAS